MKKFLFITMMMLFTITTFSFAGTPCCNSKMSHCSRCAKQCDKTTCLSTCSNTCKATGECSKTCK